MLPMFLIIFNISILYALDWWEIPRQESETELSYVGISEGAQGIDTLKDKAFISAATLIVREHFGTKVEASESFIEDTGNSKYQFMTKLESDSIVLKGLKLTDLKVTALDEGSRVFVRVTITKDDLRNSKIFDKQSEVQNIYGEGKGERFVLIKTVPSGALIQFTGIDRKYVTEGKGDARFYLPRGRYFLSIHEEGHHPVRSEISVFFEDQKHEFKLEPILGTLLLETSPSDAEVTPLLPVQGTNPFKLMPKRKYRFRVTHPDYYEGVLEYSIPDDKSYIKKFHLDPKPSTFRFFVTPSKHVMSINKKLFSAGKRITVTEDEIEVVIRAEGYETFHKTIKVLPNRDYPDEHVKLDIIKESASFDFKFNNPFQDKYQKRFIKRFEYNPFIQIDEDVHFSILPVSYFFEWTYFGLGASYNFISTHSDNGEETVNKDISDLSLNMRIFSPRFDNFQTYLNFTTGKYSANEERDDFVEYKTIKRQYNYYGFGGGFRVYTSQDFSFHLELNHIFKKQSESLVDDTQTKQQPTELKGVLGIGWEF